MAWIVVDLDGTLLTQSPSGMEGEPPQPVDGAAEAMMMLMSEGHRLTVYTSRFAPAPATERDRIKQQIEQELAAWGFPPMEVWTGTTKPDGDIFIGSNHITFDQDWGLALAQCQEMLEERGLIPAMTPALDEGAGPPVPDEEPQP